MWFYKYYNLRLMLDTYNDAYLEDILSIEKELFDEPYYNRELLVPLGMKDSLLIFFMFFPDDPVGYINTIIIPPIANIDRLGIRRKWQGSGLGYVLMCYFCGTLFYSHKIETVHLEVNESNFTAISFYKKFGFRINGCRKGYYGSDNALLMEYDLREGLPGFEEIYTKWKKELV